MCVKSGIHPSNAESLEAEFYYRYIFSACVLFSVRIGWFFVRYLNPYPANVENIVSSEKCQQMKI